MNCAAAREALSALLDDEDPGVDPDAVRAHVDDCPDCVRWYEDAERLGRPLRVSPVEETGPDIAEAILQQVELPRRGRWRRPLRTALIVAAVAQLCVGLAAVFEPLAMPGMNDMAHMNHEEAAFNLAIGVVLLIVGINPRAARHHLPMLAILVGVLGISSVFDLAQDAVEWARLATHIPVLLGLVLTAALRGPHPDRGPERHANSVLPSPPGATAREPLEIGGPIAGRHGTPPPAARRDAA